MSDEEIICTFMEPKPERKEGWNVYRNKWWKIQIYGFVPRDLDLDALYEVEARLTDAQCDQYDEKLVQEMCVIKERRDCSAADFKWHASAKQRIKTLAQILK